MTTTNPNVIINQYSLIKHAAEEGGFWGEVVELPGCVSQGETELELIQNIREGIAAVLESMDEEPPHPFNLEAHEAGSDIVAVFADHLHTWTGSSSGT